jgi:hypothetical protein
MAHFAKIDENNRVLTVLTVNNEDVLNDQNIETESVGQQYLETHNNWPAHLWIQTSYNTKRNKYYNVDGTEGDQSKALRGNYAGIGYTWDPTNQIFWPPQPFPSWTKDTTTALWKPPVDQPELTPEQQSQNDSYSNSWRYEWNESNQTWDLKDYSNL